MRALLFVPGDSPKKLEKALAAGADALIADLEDSVATDAKADARRIAAEFVREHGASTAPALYVRINDLKSGFADDDLAAVMAAGPRGIMLPKTEGGEDVTRLSVRLRVLEAEHAIEDGATRILPIITETAAATLAAGSYHHASPRLSGITWGAEDLSADVGARTTRGADGAYTDVFRLARAVTLLAAASAEVAAVDTVFPNFRDTEAFRADCIEAERDGYVAKMAIHPAQVPVINEVFTPSPEAVAHARAIADAFAAAGSPGVVGVDGQMYDRPHLRRAQRILERARAADLA